MLERDGPRSTPVHHTGAAKLYGPFELLEPLVAAVAGRERQLTVDALKRSLEGGLERGA